VRHPDPLPAAASVATLQLVPGHPTTAAEVFLWHGAVLGIDDPPQMRVVLRADDWPMTPERARQLAALLLRAADRASPPGRTSPEARAQSAGESGQESTLTTWPRSEASDLSPSPSRGAS
jgi:hypothetical protein